MNNKIEELKTQIADHYRRLEAIKSNSHISLPVLDAYQDAVYDVIEDLEDALEELRNVEVLEKVNKGLGLKK